MTGQLVGHYRILEKIGAGGMGEVFRARDERLGRDVALKLIRPASSDNPDHLRRFEQEARAAAALNHPNILAIYDVGFEGSTPYIVSELLEGRTLRLRLSEGVIPIREATGYALQIAHGLVAAHERHIVHRDLKPENLFLTNDGRVKILDFGVAKLQPTADESRSIESMTTVTKHGAVIGTVAYMSPEQLRAKAVDHRSDIFSFGAILYEMISGRRAFHGETEVDTMTAVLREEPSGENLEQAAIPTGYLEIVKHCLEKEPENRFQSAKDLAFALQTVSGSSPVTLNLPKPKPASSKRVPWIVAGVLGVATIILATAQFLRAPAAMPTYSRVTFEAGTVFAARFVPGGQSIVYSASWDGKPEQLFTTVADSLLSQPLEFKDANLLGVSHSRELALAIHGTHSGQLESVNGTLARAPLAGGAPRELLSDVRWADWDPKGNLAVVHSTNGQSRLEYPTGKVLYQTSGWISNIRFSPKADQIAFMDHPAPWDTRGSVRLVDLSGHLRNLTQIWDAESGLSWRPDGKEIWFSAIEKGNELDLMAVDLSGKVRRLLDLPVGITLQDIAADGRVLVSSNSTRLAMGYTSVGSKEDKDLSWHDWNIAHDISPDDKSVLFEDASEAVGPGYAVILRRPEDSLPIRLGEGSAGGFSPDGKWAISISMTQPRQISLLPVGPGQPRTISVTGLDQIHNGWARFFPDEKSISVNGYEAGHSARCFAVNVEDGKAKPVTPEGVLCGPIYPDGRSFIGIAPDRSLAVYDVAGGEARAIQDLPPNFNVMRWSEDGRSLYGYHAGEFPSRIYKFDLATKRETVLQELKPGAPAGVVTVSPIVISRDGKHLAYSYNETLSVLYLVSGVR